MIWSGDRSTFDAISSPAKIQAAAGLFALAGPSPPSVRLVGGGRKIAIIGLRGAVSIRPGFWVGTYLPEWEHAITQLAEDSRVVAIVIDAESSGGSMFGVDETARRVRALRGKKPIIAVLSGNLSGVAYLLASAADSVVAWPTAMVGGIGVVAQHIDRSVRNEKEGIKVTYVHSARYKVEGNPDEPLGVEARGELQRHVSRYYRMLCEGIAVNRGRSPSYVDEHFGQGRHFVGEDAVGVGLADRVGTLDAEVDRLLAENYRVLIDSPAVSERRRKLRQHMEALQAARRGQVDAERKRLHSQSAKRGVLCTIEGLAALYDETSVSKQKRQFARGAFDSADMRDARAHWRVHGGPIFASTLDGSLRVYAVPQGLRFSADVPDNALGRAIHADILANGPTGVSPGYHYVKSQTKVRGSGRNRIIEHGQIASVHDITLTRDPAYPAAWMRIRERAGDDTT